MKQEYPRFEHLARKQKHMCEKNRKRSVRDVFYSMAKGLMRLLIASMCFAIACVLLKQQRTMVSQMFCGMMRQKC